jgi:hypothetical protein
MGKLSVLLSDSLQSARGFPELLLQSARTSSYKVLVDKSFFSDANQHEKHALRTAVDTA